MESDRAAWRERVSAGKVEVRLLLDENLPRSLKTQLRGVFPEVIHEAIMSCFNVPDSEIWDFALTSDFAIVSKDRISGIAWIWEIVQRVKW